MPPKSAIWKYFSKTSDKLANCNICLKFLKTSGNTTNLTGHLKAKHGDIYSEYFESSMKPKAKSKPHNPDAAAPAIPSTSLTEGEHKEEAVSSYSAVVDPPIPRFHQKTLKDSFTNVISFKDGGDMHSRVSQAILYMICRDSQPISIIEDEGFKHLLKVTAPLYTVPSRRTIDSMIDQKYETVAFMLKERLSNVANVCLTTDIWTETHQTRSFLGVTAHFIENWVLESVILGVHELHENHTAQNLADHLTKTCSEWGFAFTPEKITAVVTDGGSNIVSAVEKAFGKKSTATVLPTF